VTSFGAGVSIEGGLYFGRWLVGGCATGIRQNPTTIGATQAVNIAVSSQPSSRFWRVCSENEHIPENAISEQLFLQVVIFEQPRENQNKYFIDTPL